MDVKPHAQIATSNAGGVHHSNLDPHTAGSMLRWLNVSLLLYWPTYHLSLKEKPENWPDSRMWILAQNWMLRTPVLPTITALYSYTQSLLMCIMTETLTWWLLDVPNECSNPSTVNRHPAGADLDFHAWLDQQIQLKWEQKGWSVGRLKEVWKPWLRWSTGSHQQQSRSILPCLPDDLPPHGERGERHTLEGSPMQLTVCPLPTSQDPGPERCTRKDDG